VNAQEPVVRPVVLKESSASALTTCKPMSAAQRRITENLAPETAPVRATFVLVGSVVLARQIHTVDLATNATTISVRDG